MTMISAFTLHVASNSFMLYFYDACMAGLLVCLTFSYMKDEVVSSRVYLWICESSILSY